MKVFKFIFLNFDYFLNNKKLLIDFILLWYMYLYFNIFLKNDYR